MASIRTVKAAARKIGADVNYDREAGELDSWLPAGLMFNATGCHCIAHHFEPGTNGIADVISDMLDDLKHGVSPCDSQDCDICSEEL